MTGGVFSRVRPATAEDAAALAQVEVTSLLAAPADYFAPGYRERLAVPERTTTWRTWQLEHPDDVLLVSEGKADGPVGYVHARCEAWHEMDARVLSLQVLPGHRRHGHGRALLHAAATELWARGCGPIGLATPEHDPVRSWYDVIGGVPVADQAEEVDGWSVRRIVYRFEVAAELARRLAGA